MPRPPVSVYPFLFYLLSLFYALPCRIRSYREKERWLNLSCFVLFCFGDVCLSFPTAPFPSYFCLVSFRLLPFVVFLFRSVFALLNDPARQMSAYCRITAQTLLCRLFFTFVFSRPRTPEFLFLSVFPSCPFFRSETPILSFASPPCLWLNNGHPSIRHNTAKWEEEKSSGYCI